MADKTTRYVDLGREIQRDINRYVLLKNKIIQEIHKIDDARFIAILYGKYVELKELDKIAMEISYTYDWTRHLHLQALKEFERVNLI